MVDTKKFSEFANGGDLQNDNTTVGLEGGVNAYFNNPWTFLADGTTGDRPAPAASMYYRLRFNTTTETYEYYSPVSLTWIELEDSASILPLLASHLAGEGASLIGLQDQSDVTSKTVQDLANATLIAQTDNGTIQNGVFLNALATGFLSVTTATGALASRTIGGTTNQIDVTNSDGAGNSVHSLSATLDFPGTFTVQASTAIDEIIDDDTFATATATNLATAESIKAYVDGLDSGSVKSVTGTLNRIDVNNTDPQNPVIDISATYVGQNSITTLGTITTGVWNGTTIAVLNGGTGVTSVTTAPTATAFAGWDANSNLSANNFLGAFASTATAGATTTLTVASAYNQEFTGVLTQTVQMPVAATLTQGHPFKIINNSSGALTINSSGGNLILTMAANTTAFLTCVLNSGTTAASWNASYVYDAGAGVISITGTADQVIASASTGNITLSLPQSIATTSSPTFAALTLTAALTVPNGGTGLASTTAYAVLCGGTTSTAALQSIASVGTSGQVLTSNGAGALPSFQSVTVGSTDPTIQKFTSGSGTYTTPTSPAPLYIRVVAVGGGGGGQGGAGAGVGVGTAGGNTTFGTTLIVANGGSNAGGAGGTASLGAAIGIAVNGGIGGAAVQVANTSGGNGAPSAFGGGGYGGGAANAGTAGATNSGAGGGGGGASASAASGPGGSAGGYVDGIIASPAASYAYAVGAAGSGGAAGASAGAGAAGGAGQIVVYEYYQ